MLPARRAQRLRRGAPHHLHDRSLDDCCRPSIGTFASHLRAHITERGMRSQSAPVPIAPYAPCHALWSLPPSSVASRRAGASRPFLRAQPPLRGDRRDLRTHPPLRALDSALTLPYSALPACQNRLARTAVANPGRSVRRRRTAGFPAAGRIPPIRRIVFVRTALALGHPSPVAWRHGPAAAGRAGPFLSGKNCYVLPVENRGP